MVKKTRSTTGGDNAPEFRRKLSETTLRQLVFQTFGRTRWTQDSPIVPDVWMKYIRLAEAAALQRVKTGAPASSAEEPVDLLLTPWSGTSPGEIAAELRRALPSENLKSARIAQSASRVVARVDFVSLIRCVAPLTGWWRRLKNEFQSKEGIDRFLARQIAEEKSIASALSHAGADIEFYRYAALVGFISRLRQARSKDQLIGIHKLAKRLSPRMASGDFAGEEHDDDALEATADDAAKLSVADVLNLVEAYHEIMASRRHARAVAVKEKATSDSARRTKGIFLVNLNRPATPSVFESRNTVKADAAERLFDISTDGIAFAVIDCGVDAKHPAFRRRSDSRRARGGGSNAKAFAASTRVAATYDFTILRDIMASEGEFDGLPAKSREIIRSLATSINLEQTKRYLKERNDDARDLDWAIVEPLIRIPHDNALYIDPCADHGTHVAGIIAADWRDENDSASPIIGMCPNLTLYDLRVFGADGEGDEFAILCALEFVGWLNRDRKNPVIHGVNLSLALVHDVDSFACGQTPVCEVCNHLVGAGTVVVAAAGNSGFDGAAKRQSMGNGYRMISITDPGNAELVITVGSTHRRDPHAYGVSYFSARGPTGDGRRKPDILAPGEKITSTIRGEQSQRMDGTSMAAPHVSGAAALLMGRYPELIGRPQRIKEILMHAATDLGREPYFQGAGLLDILRALQSI